MSEVSLLEHFKELLRRERELTDDRFEYVQRETARAAKQAELENVTGRLDRLERYLPLISLISATIGAIAGAVATAITIHLLSYWHP